MRIEAYNAVSQIYQAKKPGKVQKTGAAYGRDQVQISSIGKDIQTAKSAVANASDIRKDKVEPIKPSFKSLSSNSDVNNKEQEAILNFMLKLKGQLLSY